MSATQCAEKLILRSSSQVSSRRKTIMKKLFTLAAAFAITTLVVATTGCGSDSTPKPLITYVARSSSDSYAPHLFTLSATTATPTAVAISIPSSSFFVAPNSGATAVTYSRTDDNGDDGIDVFLMGTDGQEKPLTTDGESLDSAFSPDAKTIVYVDESNGGDEISTTNADGSNQKALYSPAPDVAYAYYPEFSPDGKSVVFYIEVTSSEPQAQTRRSGLSGISSRKYFHSRHAGASVHRSAHPQVADPTVSGWYTMALTDQSPTLVYATTDVFGPAFFSANGKALLLTVCDDSACNIASSDFNGTLTQLTTGTTTENFAPVAYGNLILFNQYDSTNSSWDIYVMDQTGTNQILVSSTANTYESLIDAYWED
jgi:Tol biopolymer transport system component